MHIKSRQMGVVAQWVAHLTFNGSVVGLNPIKSPCCFPEQETLLVFLSTGWFQVRIRLWFYNRTKINWEPYGRLIKCQISPLIKYHQNQKTWQNISTLTQMTAMFCFSIFMLMYYYIIITRYQSFESSNPVPLFALNKKLYPHCLVLVGFRIQV